MMRLPKSEAQGAARGIVTTVIRPDLIQPRCHPSPHWHTHDDHTPRLVQSSLFSHATSHSPPHHGSLYRAAILEQPSYVKHRREPFRMALPRVCFHSGTSHRICPAHSLSFLLMFYNTDNLPLCSVLLSSRHPVVYQLMPLFVPAEGYWGGRTTAAP